MVLLDLASKLQMPDTKFVVAHFDHGIREDSQSDRRLVQDQSKKHGLPFVYHQGKLGPGASEALARKARYDFLHHVRGAAAARAVITAHHQDDAIETAFINLMRGTGRKGISSLRSTDIITRPLLHVPKAELQQYAQDNQLVWHEDSTNLDDRYLRNRVRHHVVPKMSTEQRQNLLTLIERMHELNQEVDGLIANQLHIHPELDRLDKRTFTDLPEDIRQELLAAWFRRQEVSGFNKKTLERLNWAALTYKNGKLADINKDYYLLVGRDDLTLTRRDG